MSAAAVHGSAGLMQIKIGADGVVSGDLEPSNRRARIVNEGRRVRMQIKSADGVVQAEALLRTGDEVILAVGTGEQIFAQLDGESPRA